MIAMNVLHAFPRLPTKIAGAIKSCQFFALANAAAVAGPPTPAFDATNISRDEKKIPTTSRWMANIVHAK